jgi:hypothetical protein
VFTVRVNLYSNVNVFRGTFITQLLNIFQPSIAKVVVSGNINQETPLLLYWFNLVAYLCHLQSSFVKWLSFRKLELVATQEMINSFKTNERNIGFRPDGRLKYPSS